MYCSKTRRVDRQNHNHCNETRQKGFMLQIEALADSYMSYVYHRDHGTTARDQSQHEEITRYAYQIHAQDTYSKLPYLIWKS